MSFPSYRKKLRELIGVKKIDERLFMLRKDKTGHFSIIVPKLYMNKLQLVTFDSYYFNIEDIAFRIREYLSTGIIDSSKYVKVNKYPNLIHKIDILKDNWQVELDLFCKPIYWTSCVISAENAKNSNLPIVEI